MIIPAYEFRADDLMPIKGVINYVNRTRALRNTENVPKWAKDKAKKGIYLLSGYNTALAISTIIGGLEIMLK